ncbi:4,5-DOPA dioxygenase extradiol [Ramlibacter ginsenosidimutans]|uniref:4,5-DOPA dioxygenase extradiol n=1 Tax=Ramlibacter ginsenosidimutans TaxID=502333 RepID=A0A934WMR4_9BURK|nr:4,5-DOPA dioxygenase extradiol [Ramlibacter ginsenosidimutans]MBK6006890.1 4,5-DOPA dioxygenase extradiol [Ramlibacter ginsenosidimutans]
MDTNTPTRMPAAFIGHGSPMNTLESNDFTRSWRALGQALPRPRAILCVSAHWFINGTAVTAMPRPRVIHDFYGFPPELFAYDYPAPGSPEVAQEVVDLLQPTYVGLDRDSWGLDHGTWSVLAHLFPAADVPVLQLSIHAGAPLAYHVDLGARLAPLRDRGVLVLGSGNVVHNLRRLDRGHGDRGFDWADRFDAHVRNVMTTRPGELAEVASDRDCELAVPTPEHFLPLAYIAGMCAAAGETPQPFCEGRTLGSLSMTSYLLGMQPPAPRGHGDDTQSLPGRVPPEQTNT